MSDRVKRKIEETTALQIGRRDRESVHDRMGLSTRGTSDRFVEAQMVEQPPPAGPVEPGERDVIVQPTTPPDMGGAMQPPEEPTVPEEEPTDEEPEVDVDEEMKRTLFNTLSELIDLGRIGRNEQEIRQYVDDHEDEIGELIDVLDDVVDMLIGEGTVMREPKTFDVGDEEQPPTQGGDMDELKPGVGGQVPQGGTTTTIIASDKLAGRGEALHESIMTKITSGADIDLTLERATEELNEETIEYGFDSPEDLSRAMKVLDGLDVATTNIMKTNPTTINVVRDDRNKEDVERQLAAIRDAGIELMEPVAAEGMATPATLVSGPNVGQRSTVQSEGQGDWFLVSGGMSGGDYVEAHNYGQDKAAAEASITAPQDVIDTIKPAVIQASSEHEAIKKYKSGMTEGVFSDWYSVSKGERGFDAQSHGVDKKTAQAAVDAAGQGARLVRASSAKDAIAKFERRTGDVRSPEARAARGQRGVGFLKGVGKAAAKSLTAPVKGFGKGLGILYGALRTAAAKGAADVATPAEPAPTAPTPTAPTAPAPTPAAPAAPAPTPTRPGDIHPKGAVQVKVSDPTKYTETLAMLKGNPGVSYAEGDGENVWVVSDDPAIKAALAQMTAEAPVGEAYQSWTRPVMRVRAAMGEAEGEFHTVEGAEAYARDLHDLGYKDIILEELNVTRTGMAVEVVFGDKAQASASKGALLQYKGIDTVKDVGDGTLVVFTTDADPEEARNRVTTILQNARVPMEGVFKVTRWKLVESNPGGQSAIGGTTPMIGRAYNGPDEMPTPLPTASGQSGADLEAETEKCPHCGGAYMNDICINCRRIRRTPPKAEYRDEPHDGRPRRSVATEQAGAQDPELKAKYMQPFYAPEGSELPPGPEGDAVPGPGEPGYEEPEYGEEPGEAPEEPAGGALWRLDVPEDPMEMERLTDVLNQAKEAGVVASWTEIGGPEEELPPEVAPDVGAPGGDEVDLEVTPEFAGNEPAPVAPPRIGEQVGDEYDLPPEEPSAVADVEPGGAPVDELPPEMPSEEPEEEDGHYIAVEFAAETEQEEREKFPDWISDSTADPETGEGGLIIAGWKPDEGGEETPEGIGDEIPEEIPGETSEISPELSPEFSEELFPTRGSPTDEVPVPEERILGEEVGHLRNIYRAARVAEGRGDEANRRRFTEALVKHGRDRGVSRVSMARILQEDVAVLENIYPDLQRGGVEKTSVVRSDGRIELPPDLVRLREDHRAMKADGDDAGALRVMNELRFQAEVLGVDVNDVVNEAEGKYPIAVEHMNVHGEYQGDHVVVRAFYKYEDGTVTAHVARGGQMIEVPAEEVTIGAGMGQKPGWAASVSSSRPSSQEV